MNFIWQLPVIEFLNSALKLLWVQHCEDACTPHHQSRWWVQFTLYSICLCQLPWIQPCASRARATVPVFPVGMLSLFWSDEILILQCQLCWQCLDVYFVCCSLALKWFPLIQVRLLLHWGIPVCNRMNSSDLTIFILVFSPFLSWKWSPCSLPAFGNCSVIIHDL